MAETCRQFLVRKDDLHTVRWASEPLPDLPWGSVLLQLERAGFTANNVTYAVRGENLFWRFFPAPDGWFRFPVWGFAVVARSRAAGVSEGDRFYGYLPISSHLTLEVDEVTPAGFTVADAHRRDLPAIYNLYHGTAADPTYLPDREAEQALLRPVFRTSFMLDDYLADNGFFGARRVILGSASSKTALGLAFMLSRKRRPDIEVVGLSASTNLGFLQRLGWFDRVTAYEDLASLSAETPSAYVDMSGNAEVRAGLHDHLGDALRFDARVGSTHWSRMDERPPQGVQPQLFSMAEQMKKRTAEWGLSEIQRRLQEDWRAFLETTNDWLELNEVRGDAAVEAVYREMIGGGAKPWQGHLLSLAD